MNNNDTNIGYSAFISFEDSYLYNEDYCFIMSSKSSITALLDDLDYSKQEYKIEEVSFDMLKSDFGMSGGCYVLDEKSFENFKEIATETDISFKDRLNEDDEELIELAL